MFQLVMMHLAGCIPMKMFLVALLEVPENYKITQPRSENVIFQSEQLLKPLALAPFAIQQPMN